MSYYDDAKELIEKVTGKNMTNRQVNWFLAYWEAEQMNEDTTKNLARTLQTYIENDFTYEGIAEGFVDWDAEEKGDYIEWFFSM